jgi:hypothetical protein
MKPPMTYSRSLMDDLREIDVEGPLNRQVDKMQTILLYALQELERHELALAALRKSEAE